MATPHRAFVPMVVLSIVACSSGEPTAPTLSRERLAALAAVGVEAVERDGDRYVLFDAAGEAIGFARLGDAEAHAELRGDRVRTATDADATLVSCNQTTVELTADAEAISADAAATVDACDDPLTVIETLADAEDDAADEQRLRSADGCSFLGRNGWCDGENRVINRDWLCLEDGQYYVITTTEILEYADQCLGCCQVQ